VQACCKSLSQQVSDAMFELFSTVIKCHINVDNIVPICDFLLLMHPAASSYVFQNRHSFFFHNKWSEYM